MMDCGNALLLGRIDGAHRLKARARPRKLPGNMPLLI